MKTHEILVTISHAPHDAEAFVKVSGDLYPLAACEVSGSKIVFRCDAIVDKRTPAPAPAAIAPKPAPTPTPAPQPAKPAPAAKPVAPKPATPKANAPAESLDLG